MKAIINLDEIKSIVDSVDVIAAMKEGFIQYSQDNCVVPPVGELLFDNPPGDVHIKYGYIKQQDYYVIKIASGFYENVKLGIPSGQGLMLLFKQQTGELEAVLLDEGYLTNLRTVGAGTLATMSFGPDNIKSVGIIGTGTIAKLQIQNLKQNNVSQAFWLWGRDKEKTKQLQLELGDGYEVHIADTCAEVAEHCDVIITTTPSESPLLQANDINKGTLIVAIGSDTHNKQELASEILAKADIVIADSLPQSKSRGEIYRAIKDGAIPENKVLELGIALQDESLQGLRDDQIAVVDLTGVAVQDIMIASAVYSNYKEK